MKFVSKLSVISLIVLMFSFMNVANAACQGNGVTYCNASNTQSTCENTFRQTSPQIRCAWDGSTCRANGASCYASQGGACRTNLDCNTGLACLAGICESVTGSNR